MRALIFLIALSFIQIDATKGEKLILKHIISLLKEVIVNSTLPFNLTHLPAFPHRCGCDLQAMVHLKELLKGDEVKKNVHVDVLSSIRGNLDALKLPELTACSSIQRKPRNPRTRRSAGLYLDNIKHFYGDSNCTFAKPCRC